MSGRSTIHTVAAQPASVDRGLLIILALASGVSIANLYYIQPLLDVVARGLGVGPTSAGLLVTLTQLGFVIGLLVLTPLGDKLNPRNLITVLLLASAGAFAGAATAPTIGVLAAAMVALGATSVVAQILVPFAATLAPDADRGRVIGSVMTGLMLGTLLSRTVSGAVAGAVGWRSMCWLGALLMVCLAPLLHRKLPNLRPAGSQSYSQLLRSVAGLVRRESVLRWRAAYGAISFAAFTGFWTAVPFLLARPPFGMSATAIGAVALIGVPTAFAAPKAGQFADRGHGMALTGAYLFLMLVGVTLTFVEAQHFAAIIVGGFLAVLGSGCLHITNQCLVYGLDPAARNRLTTAYMSALFGGGMAGSALTATLYAAGGWDAACALLIGLTAFGLALWLLELTLRGRRARSSRSHGGATLVRAVTVRGGTAPITGHGRLR